MRESEIAAAMRLMRHHGTAANVFPVEVPLLGEILLEMELVQRDSLAAMLARYHPDRDGRIGDFLVAEGVVTADMEMRVRERDCPAVVGRRDHVVEVTLVGTAIASFPSAANRRAGHRSTGLRELTRHWQTQRRLMARYPEHD